MSLLLACYNLHVANRKSCRRQCTIQASHDRLNVFKGRDHYHISYTPRVQKSATSPTHTIQGYVCPALTDVAHEVGGGQLTFFTETCVLVFPCIMRSSDKAPFGLPRSAGLPRGAYGLLGRGAMVADEPRSALRKFSTGSCLETSTNNSASADQVGKSRQGGIAKQLCFRNARLRLARRLGLQCQKTLSMCCRMTLSQL